MAGMNRSRFTKTAALLAALVAAVLAGARTDGGAADSTAPWAMFQHDPQHTGRSAFTGPGGVGAAAWKFATAGVPGSPVVGGDGTIYLPAGYLNKDTAGYLYAINPNGTQKWRVTLGHRLPPGRYKKFFRAVDSEGNLARGIG